MYDHVTGGAKHVMPRAPCVQQAFDKSYKGYMCGGIGIGPYCMHSLPYVYVCVCARRPRQGHCKCM